MKIVQQRNKSLDALRGMAILAMVLSSSIAFGILPEWMYHAQEPPPFHAFNPQLPGITWVDLVFPFFLFSMGAAIPLALNKKLKEGASFLSILSIAGRRYLLLVFFALFTMHIRSVVQGVEPQSSKQLLPLLGFVLLFFQLYKPAGDKKATLFSTLKIIAYAGSVALLFVLPYKDGQQFSLYNSDIIIIVLANMALFGTIVWWLTRNNLLLRLGILPFVMAILLTSKEAGSWNEGLFNWTSAAWMYKFYYLKYLFIIVPGTIAGEWLLQDGIQSSENTKQEKGNALVALGCFLIILSNVILLFARYTALNLFITVTLCVCIYLILSRRERENKLTDRFFKAGAYLLLLGLFFEAFEGGIKKDPSTFSYYFVTGGLAFLLLIILNVLQHVKAGTVIINYFSTNGKNPMVAYVAGNLVLLPLLKFSGAVKIYSAMQQSQFSGFLSGVLFTALVSVITIFFTKRGWFWKT
ncbi:DUF5009 domain-containing protein [Danxiaibacter flavus]|uniref:DUF5009 domain-containing protein n=1 Tax=Danxiaibacter flavus TaxID=3049108 RepID=A0ABV3Z9F7_9BACT|nr:DUF5009 domain-containing protein [Chitinophagaceae bacterium DXS]